LAQEMYREAASLSDFDVYSAMGAFGLSLSSPFDIACSPTTRQGFSFLPILPLEEYTAASYLVQQRQTLLQDLRILCLPAGAMDISQRLMAMEIAERDYLAWKEKEEEVGPRAAEMAMRKSSGEGSVDDDQFPFLDFTGRKSEVKYTTYPTTFLE
ncbi:hypothetical protein FRB99_000669, partial [Tulasnella sp. 403]